MCASSALGILTTHRPRAFGGAFGIGFDGIELIRRINFQYGNGVIVGIISSSSDQVEMSKAIQSGAQFWIVKSDDIEPRLERFKKDFNSYKNRTSEFKAYK